ncbi:hypothetical protein AB28_2035 [Raoultella ornithinolytica 2-156-04_S1_C2]|nr:hypothetical protein AB00_1844 [Raoultella ornithinolytica 2-156-04_S1_C1]KDX13932.1 hypothetical protein AB28_2035 [Raoultella ornithinolytica 2-156-04_S1_C2]
MPLHHRNAKQGVMPCFDARISSLWCTIVCSTIAIVCDQKV